MSAGQFDFGCVPARQVRCTLMARTRVDKRTKTRRIQLMSPHPLWCAASFTGHFAADICGWLLFPPRRRRVLEPLPALVRGAAKDEPRVGFGNDDGGACEQQTKRSAIFV